MKRILVAAILLLTVWGCNNQPKAPSDHNAMEARPETKDFSGVKFASDKDPACGMPLSAGITDTATVDGKIYGFCSPECKDEFLASAHNHK